MAVQTPPKAPELEQAVRDLERFQSRHGRQAQSSTPSAALALSQGSAVSIRDCTAAEGTGLFLRVDGAQGRLFVGNDLSRARATSEPKELPFQAANNLLPQP